MKSQRQPRFVLVTRKTPLELLVEQHGTASQARFYLESRGQDPDEYEEAHSRLVGGLSQVLAAIPADRRRVRIDRTDLDRFLFAPDDVVLVVGQDGLVANTAKYLDGQLTLGVNPDPQRYDGVLCSHPPDGVTPFISWLDSEPRDADLRIEPRVMAEAEREDGQRLLALNEIFVGHRTHQSARYRIEVGGTEERHSSSGLICATGTGATGWARSICQQRALETELPGPTEPRLAWFVREPFPSVFTGTALDFGILGTDEAVRVTSLMGAEGVVFADGIESDYLEFLDGHSLTIRVASRPFRLVVPGATAD